MFSLTARHAQCAPRSGSLHPFCRWKFPRPTALLVSIIGSLMVFGSANWVLGADTDGVEGVSYAKFAPVQVVEAQFESYLEGIGKELEKKEDYEKSVQERIALDASTLVVLAQTLGLHDQENRLRDRAGKLVELALAVSKSTSDYDKTRENWQALQKAAQDQSLMQKASPEPAADLVLLMKQVPIVNNMLRRGVESKRFDRSIEKTAGYAVTIAAIAQASMSDTNYCGGEEDEEAWSKICAELRDASAEVYQAVRDKDQERAKAGAAKMVTTCDACHEKFR